MSNEDQETEFERLNVSFAWPVIEVLLMRTHGSQASADGTAKVTHLYAVAELAERLAREHFEDDGLEEQIYWTRVCRAAGLLHEVLGMGCTFEDVVAVADEAVARAVADCTADPRLPGPRRNELYANQVGRAGPVVQLVKLCDLRHEAGTLARALRGKPRDATIQRAADWLAAARLVLPTLTKVESLTTAPQVGRLKDVLNDLDTLITRLSKRRKGTKHG